MSCLLGDGLLEVLEELVEAGGHELHADPDVGGGDEAAEADDDVAAVDRLEHHVQVHQDPLRLVAVPRPSHLQRIRRKFCIHIKIVGISKRVTTPS